MRTLILSAALVVVLVSLNDPLRSQDVEIEYNKFKDQTSVMLNAYVDGNPLTLHAGFVCRGDSLCQPDQVAISFADPNDDWTYLRNHECVFLLDDETRVVIDDVIHDSKIGSGFVLEFIHTSVPFDAFLIIVNAEKVEYQVGPTQGEVTGRQMKALRQVLSYATGQDGNAAEVEGP